jgi:hypothetical protein
MVGHLCRQPLETIPDRTWPTGQFGNDLSGAAHGLQHTMTGTHKGTQLARMTVLPPKHFVL